MLGDRVALECGVPCSKPTCEFCRTGRYNACPDIIFFSSPPIDGTLRRYHVHPAAWVHPLPATISYEEGALLEPLSVALAGIERAGLRLGDSLLICGAGPIGLVSLLSAHAAGATPIVITDLDEHRLATAKTLVPRVRTVGVKKEQTPSEIAQMVKASLGEEPNLALECTGVQSSIQSAIYVSTPVSNSYQCEILSTSVHRRADLVELSLSSALARAFNKSHSCMHPFERLT